MIILQGNKIERSFSGDVLFDNINIQVDERDRIALVGRNGAGKSTLLKILVGEEAPTSGEINTKRDLNLSYLAQDSRFESSNTIYAEMLNVFADLRADEKRLRDMEMKMAELTGVELDKLMTDYDRLSEDFRQRGGFTYESDIRAILNGLSLMKACGRCPFQIFLEGKIHAWLWRKCCLRSLSSWYWTNRPTTWISKPLPGWRITWSIIREL